MSGFNADSFTDGLDYAGLFPPAQLPMGDALAEYKALKAGPEGKLVRAFSITTRRLTELPDDAVTGNEQLDLCLIGRGADALADWEPNLEADADAINETVSRFGDRVGLRTYEVRIPREITPQDAIRDLAAFEEGQAYLEVPLHAADFDIASFAAAVSESNLGLKARTGGVKPGSVPSPTRLAELIVACAQCEIPLKATAGLHHAYRHLNESTGDTEYGFLNVIAAVALAWEFDFSVEEVVEVLIQPSGLLDSHQDLFWGESWVAHGGKDLFADGFLAIGTCSVAEILTELQSALSASSSLPTGHSK